MSSITQQPVRSVDRRAWAAVLGIRELWAALTIVVMWLAVLFDALYGPDIVTSTAGGDSATVPSAVILALFAFLGTWVVARRGFTETEAPPH